VDQDAGDEVYAPGSPQYLWLQNDLASTHQPWKVVFFHVPPYSSGPHGSNSLVARALEPLFTQYGVDLVFNGHDHDYERSVIHNITYIVTGGGGAPLGGQSTSNPASVFFSTTFEAVQVSVTASQLTVAGVKPDGTRFDPFTLSQSLPYQIYLPAEIKQ
jgi:hypothetical protein